jgi:hypothetical protein
MKPDIMKLRGYRETDQDLLSGPWLAGDLLGLPLADWPALAEPVTVEPPADHGEELVVAPGVGFVRYTELDWVHRRARVEIGVRPDSHAELAPLVRAAVAHGFHGLNLRRLHGWVTPATGTATGALSEAGFVREATVPDGTWLDGRPVDREIWGAMRDD